MNLDPRQLARLRRDAHVLVLALSLEPELAAIQARKLVESALREFLRCGVPASMGSGGSEGVDVLSLDELLQRQRKTLPAALVPQIELVQRQGNQAVHARLGAAPFTVDHARPSALAAINVVHWLVANDGPPPDWLEALTTSISGQRRNIGFQDVEPAGDGLRLPVKKFQELLDKGHLSAATDGTVSRNRSGPARLPKFQGYEERLNAPGPMNVRIDGGDAIVVPVTDAAAGRCEWELWLERYVAPPRAPAGAAPGLDIDPSRRLSEVSDVLQVFGLSAFRSHQQEAISALVGGRDVFCVVPTGAGKSLIYQAAALLVPGVSVVVSPLVALMEDQVAQLRTLGYPASTVNHTTPAADEVQALAELRAGAIRLLYVSPEMLFDQRIVNSLRSAPIGIFAVDEAHCVSEWGHDFRPDYLRLALAREDLRPHAMLATTATAPPRTERDVVRELGLRAPAFFRSRSLRENLALSTRSFKDDAGRRQALVDYVGAHRGAAGIVYVERRATTIQLADLLHRRLGVMALPHHGAMPDELRKRSLEAFRSRDVDVVVATKAFGLGVHRDDVGFVLQWAMPDSLETLAQAAGRAGRDGRAADCPVWHAPGDDHVHLAHARKSFPAPERLGAFHRLVSGGSDADAACGGLVIDRDDAAARLGVDDIGFRLLLAEATRQGFVKIRSRQGNRFDLECFPRAGDSDAVYAARLLDRKAARLERLTAVLALLALPEGHAEALDRYLATGAVPGD